MRGLRRRPVPDCCGLNSLLVLRRGDVLGFHGVDLERLCELCRGSVSNVVGRLRLCLVSRRRIARVDRILDQRMCQLRGRPVRRGLGPVGLCELRGRKLQLRGRLDGLRDVFRRDVRRFDGRIGVLRVCARNELDRGVERLHGLPGRDLPGHDGRVGLHELLLGDLFSFRGKRVLQLRGRPIPDRDGLDGLFPVRCGLVFECRWRVGFRRVRVVRSRFLFGCGGILVQCLRRRQLLWRRRRVELQHLSRWLLCSEYGKFRVHSLRRRDIPDRQRADVGGAQPGEQLRRVRGGDVLDGDGGSSVDRVFPVRRRALRGRDIGDVVCIVFRRPVPGKHRSFCVRRLRSGKVPHVVRCEHERVCRLRGRPIPIGNGVNYLRRMRCGHLRNIDGIHGVSCVCRMLCGHLPDRDRLDFVRRMQRGSVLGRSGRIVRVGVRELRTRAVAARDGIHRMRCLRCGPVPNGHGRIELRELLGGHLLNRSGFHHERVPELFGGPIPTFVGVCFLHGVRCGKLARIDGLNHQRMCQLRDREVRGRKRCVGVRGLRVGPVPDLDGIDGLFELRGGDLLGDDRVRVERMLELPHGSIPDRAGFFCLHGLHRGELIGVGRIFDKCMLKLRGRKVHRQQRFVFVRRLRRRAVPNGHRRDVLLELRGGNLLGFDGVELECVLELRGGAVPNRHGNGSLRVVLGGDVFSDDGLERQRVRRLLVGSVRSFVGVVGLHGLPVGPVPNSAELFGVRKLWRWLVSGFDGVGDERLFELRRRTVPNRDGVFLVHLMPCGDLFGLDRVEQQLVRFLFAG